MNRIIKATLALSTVATALTGCSVMKQNDLTADRAIKKTEDYYQKTQINRPKSLVTQSRQVYLTNDGFKIEKKNTLPKIFQKQITYTSAANETPASVVSNLGEITGITMRITNDAMNEMNQKNTKNKGIVSYQGSLGSVLTTLTSKNGVFWNYDNNTIKIFSTETKVYALDAPIGNYNLTNNISAAANSNGSDGSNAQSTTNGDTKVSMSSNIKAGSPWISAVATIKSMLSKKGQIDTNPVEGYVTITDNPEKQEEIANYIKKINDKTNQKIAIKVDVYDVQTSSSSGHGFDIDAVAKALTNNGSISWISKAQDTLSNASEIKFKTDNSDHSVILKALNTIGKATETTSTTVYTISGQPAPIQNAVQKNYLRSVSTSISDNSTSVSLEPGTVTTGYSMTLTPRIESNNEILINMNLQLSRLLEMDTFSSGGAGNNNNSSTSNNSNSSNNTQTIQLPTIHTKSFAENMILRGGQTILIAGFQNDTADTSQNSIGNPSSWFLGGSKSTKGEKSTTVVAVTPYMIGQ